MLCGDKWDIVKWVLCLLDWWDLHCHNPPHTLTTWQWEKWMYNSVVYVLAHDWQAFKISRKKAIQGTHSPQARASLIRTHRASSWFAVPLLFYFTLENTEDWFNLHQQQGWCVPLFTFSHECTNLKAGTLSFCNLAYFKDFSVPEHCCISIMEITEFSFTCRTTENNPLLVWQSTAKSCSAATLKAIQSNGATVGGVAT